MKKKLGFIALKVSLSIGLAALILSLMPILKV